MNFNVLPITLQSLFSDSSDIVMRKWKIKSLMEDGIDPAVRHPSLPKKIEERLITVSQTKMIASLNDVSLHVLKGDPVLLVDGEAEGLALSMKKFD